MSLAIRVRRSMLACPFIVGNFIFGGGGYNNAQPAKSYFVFLLSGSRHSLGMASLRNANLFPTKDQSLKLDRDSGRILNVEFC